MGRMLALHASISPISPLEQQRFRIPALLPEQPLSRKSAFCGVSSFV